MKTHILDIYDAFRLASIISKYIDVDKIDPNASAVDFIECIVDKIDPVEYIRCVMIMTKQTEEDVKKEFPLDVLTAFIEGLKANRVVALLSFWKSIGL